MPISINGTGSITGLSAGGLPDASVTAADLASGAARSNFGAGAVLQVAQAFKSDTFTTTSASWTDITGLSVSITPASSSSKILVMFSVFTGETNSQFSFLRIVRDSTAIGIGDSSSSRGRTATASWSSGTNNVQTSQNSVFLDSPSTTSQITYKVQTIATGGQSIFINRNARDLDQAGEPRGSSSITVMEIAG